MRNLWGEWHLQGAPGGWQLRDAKGEVLDIDFLKRHNNDAASTLNCTNRVAPAVQARPTDYLNGPFALLWCIIAPQWCVTWGAGTKPDIKVLIFKRLEKAPFWHSSCSF
jgi:hypothetical protein